MEDDDSTLEEIKIDRQRLAGGGASITQMGDNRVTRLMNWFWTSLGLAVVAGSFTVANNLYQLNLTVAQGVKNDLLIATQIKDHEDRLRKVERDVSTLEGKVFRGVAGYEDKTHAAR